jgi:hypothetical protein
MMCPFSGLRVLGKIFSDLPKTTEKEIDCDSRPALPVDCHAKLETLVVNQTIIRHN